MAVKRKQAQSPQSGGPDGTDRVMLVSMALVVAAIVVGLHVQMGLALGFAALVGMALFLGIVGFQAWRHSEADRAALSGELHRLEAEVMRLRATAPARAGMRATRSEPETEWEECTNGHRPRSVRAQHRYRRELWPMMAPQSGIPGLRSMSCRSSGPGIRHSDGACHG